MRTCEDCGCRVYGGICTNCQEELYIMETQYHEDPFPISKEFMNKVQEQKDEIERKKMIGTP